MRDNDKPKVKRRAKPEPEAMPIFDFASGTKRRTPEKVNRNDFPKIWEVEETGAVYITRMTPKKGLLTEKLRPARE